MCDLLRAHNATVIECHSHTLNLKEEVRGADVLVVAVRQPGLVTGDWVKEGAVIIDVGINSIPGQYAYMW